MHMLTIYLKRGFRTPPRVDNDSDDDTQPTPSKKASKANAKKRKTNNQTAPGMFNAYS